MARAGTRAIPVSAGVDRGITAVIEPFSASLPVDAGVLFDFRRSLRRWLLAAHLAPAAEDALVLAVHEAVANGVEHANGSPIRVQGSLDSRGVLLEITTSGSWVAHEEAEGRLAEHGRGLALMRALADELEIVVDDERITIRLRPSQS